MITANSLKHEVASTLPILCAIDHGHVRHPIRYPHSLALLYICAS